MSQIDRIHAKTTAPAHRAFDLGPAELKVRIRVADADALEVVGLHMFQDFGYLDMSNEAPEREAELWAEAISEFASDNVASAQVADVAVRPRGSAGPIGLPHADIVLTLAQWTGAGVVALLVQQLWEKVRQKRIPRSSDVARRELAIGEAEALARWIIVANNLDESARESWRLLPLRGWSNAKEIPVSPRGA